MDYLVKIKPAQLPLNGQNETSANTQDALSTGLAPSTSVLDVSSVLYALAFSVVLAVVAGLYPAARAARLTPVEAMSRV